MSTSSKSSSSSRRAAAREAQRRQAEAAKRRRLLVQVGIVAAVALVAIGIVVTAVVLGRGSSSNEAPAASGTVSVAGASVPFAVDGTAFRIGPADAKAKVDLWVDYSCPHCQEFEAANNESLNQLVAAGNVAVSYHNIQIVTEYGTRAGSASACVAVNDTAKWPTVNAGLYANHSATTDAWTPSQFADWAGSQGVNSQAADCIRANTYAGWIGGNTQAAAQQGISSTPTMLLNGQPSELLSGPALTEAVTKLANG